jgi:RNA polymerase sigma-70 factor (ECF subfamily)
MDRELRALVRRFRRGDATAFAELHARTRVAVFRYAHSYLDQPEAAEEVAQDVYLALVASDAELPASGSVLGYLLNGARFRALDRLKRGRVEDRARSSLREAWLVASQLPESQLEARQELEQLNRALDELPAEQRSVVLLRVGSGLTFAEIAQAEDVPLGTVLTRHRRAAPRGRPRGAAARRATAAARPCARRRRASAARPGCAPGRRPGHLRSRGRDLRRLR